MATGTSDDLRASGQFSPEHGLAITTVPTTTLPYRLSPNDAIKIPKGASWTYTVTWYDDENTPADLATGYTATFTVRVADGATALLSLTQSDGITLGTGEGNISIARTAAQTGALDFVRGWAQLSLIETATSKTTRLVEGYCDLVGQA